MNDDYHDVVCLILIFISFCVGAISGYFSGKLVGESNCKVKIIHLLKNPKLTCKRKAITKYQLVSIKNNYYVVSDNKTYPINDCDISH